MWDDEIVMLFHRHKHIKQIDIELDNGTKFIYDGAVLK